MARRALSRYRRIHAQYRVKAHGDLSGAAREHAHKAGTRLAAAQRLPRGHANRKTVASQIRYVRSQASKPVPFRHMRIIKTDTRPVALKSQIRN